ncbi:MAG: molybdopterin molybdotransferase MoeA [Solirubrobacterales bacterium]
MAAKLIEIDDARRLVVKRASLLSAEQVALRDALGRVLAADAAASDPVPGFDNSAMDGFAVRATDTAAASAEAPVRLSVVGESRAGRPARGGVGPGEAILISTGALVPDGADAVVRVEDTSSRDGRVEVTVAVEAGRNVRRAGEDIGPDEEVLRRGTRLGPSELGVLASIGSARLECVRRPRAFVLATGDELYEPDEPLGPGGVRNSNAYTVPALIEGAGAEVAGTYTVPDEPRPTRAAIERALGADVVVICGGVSVGEHDHVRSALSYLGAEEVFWGVALRPGKPTWFGTHPGGALVFGLPGNPVSAMVTFLLLARPAIEAQLGLSPDRERATAILDEEYAKSPGRAHAVRCRLELRDDGWHARTTGEQGSHVLTSMLGADALAIIPTDTATVSAGTRVEIELLRLGR